MIKALEKKVNINFSKIFHVTFDLDEQFEEKFSAAFFFLANHDGQIITMREIGGFVPSVFEVVYGLADKPWTKKLPYEENGYFVDALPITIDFNSEKWNGYFGCILAAEEGEPETLRSLLIGFKQSLKMAVNYLEYKQKYERYKKKVNTDQIVVQLFKDTNYSNVFDIFGQSFLDKLKELVKVGDFTLFLLNRNEDLLLPRLSTKPSILQNTTSFVLSYHAICSDLDSLKNNQVPFLSKGFSKESREIFLDELYEDYVIIPLEGDGRIFTVIVYGVQHGKVNFQINTVLDLINELKRPLHNRLIHETLLNDQKRKKLLLQVTKKFHSSMDVSEILSEIIYALKQIFPSFNTQILLSHEWEVSDGLPVIQLSYDKDPGNQVATNAYLTGKIQIEDIVKERRSIVYAPLRGKQGVYGVLKIIANDSFVFPKDEIDFIEVLADTGGNAIENAELYQQSRRLVEDLQLINKTSHQLNSNLRLSETINYMTQQIKSSFSAQEIGFFMLRENGEIEVIEGSTNYFLKESCIEEIHVFCDRIKKDKDALFIGDLASQEPYLLKPFRSFIAVPMIQSGELKGTVIIVHEEAYYFSFDKFKLLQSLIDHSTMAFTNSMLHEELEKLVITDHLTRLYARSYLDEKIQYSMEKDAYGCFILMDIDDFKQINDVHGHQKGDDIIIQVANVLKKNIKDFDIAARWGGEELAVYLSKVDKEVGKIVAERIRKIVANETSPQVTISCGVADWQQTSEGKKSIKTLFNQADHALYTAKRQGKNIVVVYDENTCYL
ncbi:diguanylate cyclase [Bacillaceae bacterium IKA-2]|nr:diguanylate cyclase [Bacillaceae bacterium IKA-2]